MLAFVIRRLAQSIAVLFAMSVLVFASVYMIGNPADILISMDADQSERARLMSAMGLDQPLPVQYLSFLKRALQGDLGNSFVHGAPAIALVFERLPATLELACVAMLLAVLLGVPLGLWAGLRPESWAGKAIMTGSILGFSLPTFWVGLMLIVVFSVQLGWLPAGGRGPTQEILGLQLSVFSAGTREALTQDYVKFARAKGLSPGRVVGVHVLKNILVPIVTVVALEFGALIAFAAVTETIFAWPGAGKLIIEAISSLDRPVVVAYLLVVVLMFTLLNLFVDIAYSALDPRVRLADHGA
jgi:peptide/nickel transport system permease protein